MSRKKIIFLLIFIGVIIGIRFTPLASYFTFQNLQLQKHYLQDLVQQKYVFYLFLYFLIYLFSVALSIPGAAILTIAGGFLFGVLPTVLVVNLAATVGAAGAFLASRYLVGKYFQEKYSEKLEKFNKEILSHGHNYLLILRLIPIFPFFLINIFSGLTNISLKTFIWTTAVGIVPGTFLYAFAGKQIDYVTSPSEIFSSKVWIIFLILVFLIFINMFMRKKFMRNKKGRL